MAEALVAYAHYLGMVALALTLALEWMACAPGAGDEAARRLARIDLAYLAAAIVMLGTGLLRAFWFGKGVAFYSGNPVFWVKMALFAAIGLVSIPPTLQFLRWSRALRAGQRGVVRDFEMSRARLYVTAELGLLLLVPLLATLMARGIGTPPAH